MSHLLCPADRLPAGKGLLSAEPFARPWMSCEMAFIVESAGPADKPAGLSELRGSRLEAGVCGEVAAGLGLEPRTY